MCDQTKNLFRLLFVIFLNQTQTDVFTFYIKDIRYIELRPSTHRRYGHNGKTEIFPTVAMAATSKSKVS